MRLMTKRSRLLPGAYQASGSAPGCRTLHGQVRPRCCTFLAAMVSSPTKNWSKLILRCPLLLILANMRSMSVLVRLLFRSLQSFASCGQRSACRRQDEGVEHEGSEGGSRPPC